MTSARNSASFNWNKCQPWSHQTSLFRWWHISKILYNEHSKLQHVEWTHYKIICLLCPFLQFLPPRLVYLREFLLSCLLPGFSELHWEMQNKQQRDMPFPVAPAFEGIGQLLEQAADAFWTTHIHFPGTYFTADVFISTRIAE